MCDAIIPSEVRAFMLLKRAGVEDGVSRSLVMSKLVFAAKDTLYEQMERS